VVFGGGNDVIDGDDGNDYFYASLLEDGDAVDVSGNNGTDTLSFEAVQNPLESISTLRTATSASTSAGRLERPPASSMESRISA
jgi:Ca2+-binding RTX toxin-like protein